MRQGANGRSLPLITPVHRCVLCAVEFAWPAQWVAIVESWRKDTPPEYCLRCWTMLLRAMGIGLAAIPCEVPNVSVPVRSVQEN